MLESVWNTDNGTRRFRKQSSTNFVSDHHSATKQLSNTLVEAAAHSRPAVMDSCLAGAVFHTLAVEAAAHSLGGKVAVHNVVEEKAARSLVEEAVARNSAAEAAVRNRVEKVVAHSRTEEQVVRGYSGEAVRTLAAVVAEADIAVEDIHQ